MAIDHQIDEQADDLIFSALRLFDKAEEFLSERYALARSNNDRETLEYVLQKLVFLHSLRKDYPSAERAYIQWENESQDPSLARSENAFFLFSLARDYTKALAKVEEVEKAVEPRVSMHVASQAEICSLFRVLHVRGRSLLKLGRTSEIADLMNHINRLVQENPEAQFGFELDLVEECLGAGLVVDECEVYLQSAHWSSYDSGVFETRKREALKRLDLLRKQSRPGRS